MTEQTDNETGALQTTQKTIVGDKVETVNHEAVDHG